MSEVIQLSVLIESEAGRVSEVTRLLGEAGINIRGFSVSDTAEHGILRLIVDKPPEGARLLRDARRDGVVAVNRLVVAQAKRGEKGLIERRLLGDGGHLSLIHI